MGASVTGVPDETLRWLLEPDNPAVAVRTRRELLRKPDDAGTAALWRRRNAYPSVAAILDAQHPDGGWLPPEQDYAKYRGNLWQVIFLGELWADPDDERVVRAIGYALSRQHASGAWGTDQREASNGPCLTANVARSLARMGLARDERVIAALAWLAAEHERLGYLGCPTVDGFTLNGYCHMLTPKLLLLLAEVPHDVWPDGADALREAAVAALRAKEVHRCLPKLSRQFAEAVWPGPAKEAPARRERFIAEHAAIEYGDKPGWLRFGFPLSYNSDALEALAALAGAGEDRRPEYEAALAAVRGAADARMRWTMRNSLNGKMVADVEVKGAPSKWLTLRALSVLAHFGA